MTHMPHPILCPIYDPYAPIRAHKWLNRRVWYRPVLFRLMGFLPVEKSSDNLPMSLSNLPVWVAVKSTDNRPILRNNRPIRRTWERFGNRFKIVSSFGRNRFKEEGWKQVHWRSFASIRG